MDSASVQIPISKLGWLSVAPLFMQFRSAQLRPDRFPFVRIVHIFSHERNGSLFLGFLQLGIT